MAVVDLTDIFVDPTTDRIYHTEIRQKTNPAV
jgi:hypothetical protein